MKSHPDREAVLHAFAVEPAHDRETLERYLKAHPDLAEELIDLSSELRLAEGLGVERVGEVLDPGADAAWEEFLGCKPAEAACGEAANPFARYRGAAFATLAQSLNVPRSILTALRDGLVEPQSVPRGFLTRFAEATGTSIDSTVRYLSRPQQVPGALAFKSDAKPSHQGRTTFRSLVQHTAMTDEQRLLLLRECDEDELP